jgi:hypothetical protein
MEKSDHHVREAYLKPLLYVFLIGAAIRLYSSYFTFYINSDGVLYINQAKMIYYGRWELLPSSGLTYLANYPFFIAGAFMFFRDWLFAAHFVSFIFGSLTLIPIYLLFRRFFNYRVSFLGSLVYAFMPIIVSRSADVVRDPVYWFFLVTGIYLFTFNGARRYKLYLILSSISLLMATWARVEAFIIVIASCLYILIYLNKRFTKLLLFLSPLIVVAVGITIGTRLLDIDAGIINRTPEIAGRATHLFQPYISLVNELEDLESGIPGKAIPLRNFISKARNFAWLIALSTLVNEFLEGFFYPFCLILFVGFHGCWQKLKKGKELRYFTILVAFGCALLYLNTLQTWIIDGRFLALVAFPLFIYLGYGLEKLILFLETKFKIKENIAVAVICTLIVLFGLSKNLNFREKDKLVFKQIGAYIAELETNNRGYISTLASDNSRQLSFYSNINNEGLILPPINNLQHFTGGDLMQFIKWLKKKQIKYFLWEEEYWIGQPFNVINDSYGDYLKELNQWWHVDTGRMTLFEVKP